MNRMWGTAMESVRDSDSARAGEVRGSDAFDLLQAQELSATFSILNQPDLVPGLLQVESYAREVIRRLSDHRSDDNDVEAQVAQRMKRAAALQERLRGGAELSVVIDEAAFHRAGDSEAMRAQVTSLIAMVKNFRSMHLSIVPLHHGPHLGLRGAFELHRSADGLTTSFFEALPEDLATDDDAVFQRIVTIFRSLEASAAQGDEAVGILEAISAKLL